MKDMKWFEIWLEDRRWIASVMRSNMADDLAVGYDPNGHSIRQQVVDIEEYEMETDRQVERFKYMEERAVERWCYFDLKKRGAIL